MKNEQKIIQNFIGEINGIKITHEPTYWETGNVLDRLLKNSMMQKLQKNLRKIWLMELWSNGTTAGKLKWRR